MGISWAVIWCSIPASRRLRRARDAVPARARDRPRRELSSRSSPANCLRLVWPLLSTRSAPSRLATFVGVEVARRQHHDGDVLAARPAGATRAGTRTRPSAALSGRAGSAAAAGCVDPLQCLPAVRRPRSTLPPVALQHGAQPRILRVGIVIHHQHVSRIAVEAVHHAVSGGLHSTGFSTVSAAPSDAPKPGLVDERHHHDGDGREVRVGFQRRSAPTSRPSAASSRPAGSRSRPRARGRSRSRCGHPARCAPPKPSRSRKRCEQVALRRRRRRSTSTSMALARFGSAGCVRRYRSATLVGQHGRYVAS